MTDIQCIKVGINTGDFEGAGTDGDIYIGICGREFMLDTGADDFERGSSREYVLGIGANVNNKSSNDPTRPQLAVEDIETFPVYIRFNPEYRADRWNVIRVGVSVNLGSFNLYEIRLEREGGIWLGYRSGLFLHLRRHIDAGVK